MLFLAVNIAPAQSLKKVYKYISKERFGEALAELKRFNQPDNYTGSELLMIAYASQYIYTTSVAYDPIKACEQFHSLQPSMSEINEADKILKKYKFSREIIKKRINDHAFEVAKDNIDLWERASKEKANKVKNCISDEKLLEQLEIREIRKELKEISIYNPDNIKRLVDKLAKTKREARRRTEIINEKTKEVTFRTKHVLIHVADSAYEVARDRLSFSCRDAIRNKDLYEVLKILQKYDYQNRKDTKTDYTIQTILKKYLGSEINTCNCTDAKVRGYKDKLYITKRFLLPETKTAIGNIIAKLEADCEINNAKTITFNKSQYDLNAIPENELLSDIGRYQSKDKKFKARYGPIIQVGENLLFSDRTHLTVVQGEFESYNVHKRYDYQIRNRYKTGANLFQENGVFLVTHPNFEGGYPSDLIYINLRGCLKSKYRTATSFKESVAKNSQFAVKVADKIYSFKVKDVRYTGNSNEGYSITAMKAYPIQGGGSVLGVKRSRGVNVYYIGAILDDFKSPTRTSYNFNGDLSRTGSKWDIKDVFLLKSKNIALVVELSENYERYDPRINIPIPQKFTSSLILIFDEDGKTILSKKKIIEADYYIPSKKGGFYALVENGGFLSKYNANAELEWNISLGISDERNVKHDKVHSWWEIDNTLYLGGHSFAKGYVGKKDPIIYEVSLSDHTSKNYLINDHTYNTIGGLITLDDKLFYRIDNVMYNFEQNR